MKIQYFSGEAWEEPRVREKLSDDEIVFHPASIASAPELKDDAAEVLSVFIDSKIGEAELSRFPSLKLVATRSTGFDHIDLSACEARGISVANVPFYGENTVAEFAFALILALSRKIVDSRERVRQAGSFSQEGLRGFDLAGKTLGIVGVGHIGVHAIRMGNGFGMKVLAFDVRHDDALAARMGFSYAPLEDVLAKSDVLSLHVPYNEHTRHLINRGNIGTVKKGAILVNTARGGVVETEALVQGLRSGVLAGVGLDVLEEEGELAEEDVLLSSQHPNEAMLRTTLANHWLLKHPAVLVTPHVAFNTTEAVERIVDTTIDNIRAFAAGAAANIVG